MLTIETMLKNRSSLRVLYVEDDEEARRVTTLILENFIDNVIAAHNGKDGLSKYRNSEVDLIITDIEMPKLNGLDMIEEIRKTDKDIPILILSAYSEINYFLQSIKLGVDGYLVKPINLKQLTTLMQKVIQKINLENNAKQNLKLLHEYQEVIDKSNIVSKTDIDGIITYVNEEFCRVSKYSKSELIGKSHNIIRDPDMPASLFQEMWDTIKNRKKIWKGRVKNRAKDGQAYYVDSTIKPILDKDGNIVEYIAIRNEVTKLINLNHEVKQLHKYDIEQQNSAREKIEVGIRNDIDKDKAKVIYAPLDILSGDFYSLYKCKNGATFIYIVDGQGHGISPALTIFSVSSVINNIIDSIETLDELIDKIFPIIKTFLGEEEQLSYTMVMIGPDSHTISYSSGGMYPFLVKTTDKIIKIKANNLPFMNFLLNPSVDKINLKEWESLLIYSDGFVEHEESTLSRYRPLNIINEPSRMADIPEILKSSNLEDDVTLLYLTN